MKVLFLCTGNACRSQMAEGWLRALGGGDVEVRSAGLEAHGLDPRAVEAMHEVGVDISMQTSSVVEPADLTWADLVVTVCGHADESCPVLPPDVTKQHWPLPDPAAARGTSEEVRRAFTDVRDDLHHRIATLLSDLT